MHNINRPELTGLEYQIESLLKNLKQFKAENEFLRQRLAQLQHEKEALDAKNRHAADQIDHVITQLKGEQGYEQ